MGGANNMPTGGGNTGFFGGNAPSSGNVGGGKGTSSSQSSYLPQGNTQMGGYANSLQQPSYGVPPSSYYQSPSQSNAQQRQMPQQIQPGTGQQDQSTAMQAAYNASQNAQGQGLGQGQATYNASQNVYGQANPQTATTMNQQQNPQQKVDAFIKEAGAAGKTFSPEEQKSMLENATKSFENEQAFREGRSQPHDTQHPDGDPRNLQKVDTSGPPLGQVPADVLYNQINQNQGGTFPQQPLQASQSQNNIQQGQGGLRNLDPFHTPNFEQSAASFRPNQAYGVQSQGSLSGGGMGNSKGTSPPAYGGGYSNPFASQQFSNTGYNAPTRQRLYAPPTPGSYGNTGASQALQSPQMVMPQAQAQIPAPVTNNPSNMGHSKGINPNSFKGTNVPFFAKGGEVNGQRSGVAVKDLTHEDVERIIRALRLAHFVVKEPKE